MPGDPFGPVHLHGAPPRRTAVLHGGPGAPGSAADFAALLARRIGVVEPWQTARSVDGQVAELAAQLRAHADGPAMLVGHSWGAVLGYLLVVELAGP
jgi:pimeloyl-ACP methyl ester carboxylesterase